MNDHQPGFFQDTDTVAQSVARSPLPDPGGIGATQPFAYEGAWVHAGAIELLMKMVEGYRPGRLQQRLQRTQLEALGEAGLV